MQRPFLQKFFIITLIILLASAGIGTLFLPNRLAPENAARQQSLAQLLAPAGQTGLVADENGRSLAAAPIIVNLSDAVNRSVYAGDPFADELEADEVEQATISAWQKTAQQLPQDSHLSLSTGLTTSLTQTAVFDALDIRDCCGGGRLTPPDPELAVGPNHMIVGVNSAFAIYGKSGDLLAGPVTFASLFHDPSQTLPASCNTYNNSPFLFDPNILYDQEADRFFMAVDGNFNHYCIAVSASNDPTGSWHVYGFFTDPAGNNSFDFPHAGIGREAIFMGANNSGGRLWAFDKWALYAGITTTAVFQTLTPVSYTPIPMTLHGFAQNSWPISNTHYFIASLTNGADYQLYAWTDPFGSNSLTLVNTMNLNSATGVTAGYPLQVPQQGGGAEIYLEGNSFFPLDLEYRNGRLWTTMTISCNPGGGTVDCVRWAEIEPTTGSVVQAGVIASDADYRIFPDLAVDGCDNMAIGYTKSNINSHPSIWVSGRQASDPANQLQNELLLKAGEAIFISNEGSGPPFRWGDYTGMTTDPDGQTFWYLGEYSKTISDTVYANWGTSINQMQFPGCDAPNRHILSGPQTAIVYPGQVVTYPVTLTDLGSRSTYSLTVSGNNWPTNLLITVPITVTTGQTVTFDLRVETPPGIGLTDVVTLTATPTNYPMIAYSLVMTTQTAVPRLTGQITGTDIILLWEDLVGQSSNYALYRHDQPYFLITTTHLISSTLSPFTISYTDVGIIPTETQGFYKLAAQLIMGEITAVSNEWGFFKFAIQPGE